MLSTFENLPSEATELLEAAGHTEIKSIFDHSYEDISQELLKANSILNIVDGELDNTTIEGWLTTIEQQAGKEFTKNTHPAHVRDNIEQDSKPQKNIPVNQAEPQANLVSRKDLQLAPIAIPLSESFIDHHDLDLTSLPQGTTQYPNNDTPSRIPTKQQSAETNYLNSTPQTPAATSSSPALYGNESTSAKSAPALDKSRIISMEEYQQEGSKVTQPVQPKVNNITRTTLKETNEGVNPDSKFFIKGVLHQDIPKFKLGSYSFIFFNLLILAAVAGTAMVLVDKEKYWWGIYSPTLIFPAIFIYFTACQKASCPICTQKQYALKRCLKHKNAHRWPILGYMLPTCLHALFFKWFRCIFCGTSVRLKE